SATTATPPPPAPHPTSPTKPAGGGDPLSSALAKNQPAIEGCFRDHAADLNGSPEVSVRFVIDKDGIVKTAELTPVALTSTPLGGCIVGVATRTRFPAQPRDTTKFS